uniref:E3 ubiquitin-protein ligase makorin-2 n=1 Tax=Acanthochromis polyacanthus TaxID=80966 RepID=A0A3Q1GFF6_9TELE
MSTKQVTCRYFLHGVCREGSRCLFSHDPSSSKPSTICKFYQRGVCAYGERCRYDHIRPSFRAGGGGASEDAAGGGGAGGRVVRGGVRKVVLRDRVLGSDGVLGGPVDAVGSEVAAAAPQSYVDAIRTGLDAATPEAAPPSVGRAYQDLPQLCPYAAAGHCYYDDSCPYLHGDLCEVCGLRVLHPHDPEQRRMHEKVCLLAFEADMEKAFAAQLSQDKVCSICMEVVVQKANPSDRRFGILSSCCHTFCLACIRQWRCTRNFCNKIIKSCSPSAGVCSFLTVCVQFMNSVRLWDFIEEREQRSVPPLPSLDDDITELRELFMQMSAPSHDDTETPPTEAPPTADQ